MQIKIEIIHDINLLYRLFTFLWFFRLILNNIYIKKYTVYIKSYQVFEWENILLILTVYVDFSGVWSMKIRATEGIVIKEDT